eukprot:6210087-Pleurochrysis_carterae.AAC.3
MPWSHCLLAQKGDQGDDISRKQQQVCTLVQRSLPVLVLIPLFLAILIDSSGNFDSSQLCGSRKSARAPCALG